MKNEQKKSDNHNRIYIIIIAVVLCTAFYSFVRSYGNDAGTAEVHQRTDATMGRIEKEHTNAGRELDATGRQLDSAGAAAKRADEFITASQERVAENTAGLADCQRIVSECQKIVADSQRIYREIEATNSDRKGSGGGS